VRQQNLATPLSQELVLRRNTNSWLSFVLKPKPRYSLKVLFYSIFKEYLGVWLLGTCCGFYGLTLG